MKISEFSALGTFEGTAIVPVVFSGTNYKQTLSVLFDAPNVAFTPGDAGDWATSPGPVNLQEATDELAARINAVEGGVSDGDKGDIIVSSGGTVWTLESVALTSLTGLTPTVDGLPYYTGASSSALTTLTSFARGLLDDADASTMRATLGLSGVSTRDIAGTANEIAVANGDGISGNPTISLPSTVDLGGKTSFELPNSAAPTVDADGEIAVDTTVTDFSHGILKYYSGEEMAVVAMPVAQLSSPTNNYVVTYDSTADEFQLKAASGGSSKYRKVFRPRDNEPPTSNFATLDTRNAHPVLDFDTTTQETAIFSDVISAAYGGGDITVTVIAALTSATSGTLGWDVTFERVGTSQDIDADGFATAQTITATTVPGTSGQLLSLSVSITAGSAGTDSLAAGEAYRLRVRRDVANDTATGDAELWAVVVSEN